MFLLIKLYAIGYTIYYYRYLGMEISQLKKKINFQSIVFIQLNSLTNRMEDHLKIAQMEKN